MDFAVPEKTKVILEMTQEFLEKEVYPLEPHFVGKKFRDMWPEIKRCQAMVKKMELWGPQIPKELGGMGLIRNADRPFNTVVENQNRPSCSARRATSRWIAPRRSSSTPPGS